MRRGFCNKLGTKQAIQNLEYYTLVLNSLFMTLSVTSSIITLLEAAILVK